VKTFEIVKNVPKMTLLDEAHVPISGEISSLSDIAEHLKAKFKKQVKQPMNPYLELPCPLLGKLDAGNDVGVFSIIEREEELKLNDMASIEDGRIIIFVEPKNLK
jgi:hypothetical protein